MAKIEAGKKYGHLTFTGERIKHGSGHTVWYEFECKCDCGTVKFIRQSNLSSGATTSCGCTRLPYPSNRKSRAPETVTFKRERDGKEQVVTRTLRNHGQSKTPLYRQWVAMVRRCESPAAHNYKWYGGRGVEVCQEWREDFMAYKAWAEDHGYERGMELDRLDPNGDYCPENCQFTTKIENIRRKNPRWTPELDKFLSEESKRTGLPVSDIVRIAVEEYSERRRAHPAE